MHLVPMNVHAWGPESSRATKQPYGCRRGPRRTWFADCENMAGLWWYRSRGRFRGRRRRSSCEFQPTFSSKAAVWSSASTHVLMDIRSWCWR